MSLRDTVLTKNPRREAFFARVRVGLIWGTGVLSMSKKPPSLVSIRSGLRFQWGGIDERTSVGNALEGIPQAGPSVYRGPDVIRGNSGWRDYCGGDS